MALVFFGVQRTRLPSSEVILYSALHSKHCASIVSWPTGNLLRIGFLQSSFIGVERLRDPPTEWSRQFEARNSCTAGPRSRITAAENPEYGFNSARTSLAIP